MTYHAGRSKLPAAVTHERNYAYWNAYRAYMQAHGGMKGRVSRFYWQSLQPPFAKGFSLDGLMRVPGQPGIIAVGYAIYESGIERYQAALTRYQPEIERALGYPLSWAGRFDDHYWLYTAMEADAGDQTDWPNQFAWYREKHAQFTRAIALYLGVL